MESIKEFQRRIFRARGMVPQALVKAKEELQLALKEIERQRELGGSIENLNEMQNYIDRIIEAIDLDDTFLVQDVFKDFFQYISDKMLFWVRKQC